MTFAACSGTVMDDLTAQAGGNRHDLVTFSFGGNDIGFAWAVIACVSGGSQDLINPWTARVNACPPDGPMRDVIASRIGGRYRDFLRRAANDIVTRGGNIVVVGYPALVEEPDRWTGVAQAIDLCNGFRRDDADRVRGWAGLLNAEIGAAVADINRERPNEVGLTFANIQDGAGGDRSSTDLYEPQGHGERHNLCGTDSWINGPSLTNGFHPNHQGHQHTGGYVAGVIRGLDWSRFGGTSAPPSGAPAPSSPSTPPSDGGGGSPTTPAAPTPPSSGPRTYPEQQGSRGANTFTNPNNASGPGPRIEPMQWVDVACKVYAPQIQSANPDGYWYRIASAPWNGQYYAVANTFWNGDVPNQLPYTHNTDFAVPDC
jgi:lysophospholipase L1-like esterase